MTMDSIFQLEQQSNELRKVLQENYSIHYKRICFMQFFQKIVRMPHQERFISYYLEFENWLSILTEQMERYHWSPDALAGLSAIVESFMKIGAGSPNYRQFEKAAANIRLAQILAWLWVGDLKNAIHCTGIKFPEPVFLSAKSSSEIQVVEQFLEIIRSHEIPLSPKIANILRNWMQENDDFADDHLNVIFIDKFPSDLPQPSTGLLIQLSGAVRERPRDAEEDRVTLNNRFQPGAGSQYWSFLDGITAARKLPFPSPAILKRHYSFQFSISEKAAELHGNSLGAAVGILAYTLMINRYYNAAIIKIGKNSAITSSIQADGKIKSVDASGLKAKIRAVFFSPIKRLYVPAEHFYESVGLVTELKQRYPQRHLIVEGLEHLSEALHDRNLMRQEKISLINKSKGALKRISAGSYAIFLSGVGIFLLILLLFSNVFDTWHHRQPDHYQLMNNELHLFDAEKNLIWSHDFRIKPGNSRLIHNSSVPNVVIYDLDHDGAREVLFGSYDNTDARFSGHVWCFNRRGEIVWKRHIGHQISIGGKIYDDHFRIYSITVKDLNHDGQNEIIVVAHHWPYFPECVQILNVQGELLGEYWHMGQTEAIAFFDLESDGSDEIFLGGQNNEYGHAVVAVLDFQNLHGFSPQTIDSPYYPDRLARGTEKYYLRFPATEFKDLDSRDKIHSIQIHQAGISVTITNSYPNLFWGITETIGMLYYDFDSKMDLLHPPSVGDVYKILLKNNLNINLNAHDFSKYNKIEYWNGEQWTDKTVVNSHWKENENIFHRSQ